MAFGGGDTAATIVASIARRLHRSERALCGGASLEAGEILSDLLAEFWSDAADRADLLGRALSDSFERAEGLQQSLLARLGHAGNFIEQTLADPFLEQQTVEAVGKTVRLIADPLQKLESSAVLRQAQGEWPPRDDRFPRIPWPSR